MSLLPVSADPDLSGGSLDAANALIAGDNLAAMQALAETVSGHFRCAYLDPPYNTGATWEHYRDAQRSSDWQDFMAARLRALRGLMRDDGVVWLQIDDREHAYLQVVADGVFGRDRRLCTIVVKMSELSGVKMSHAHHRVPKLKEYLLVYGMGPDAVVRPRRVLKDADTLSRYLKYYTKVIANPSEPPERWVLQPLRQAMAEAGVPYTTQARRDFQLKHRDRVVYRTNNRFLSTLHFDTPTAAVTSPKGVPYVWWEGKQMLFLRDHVETVEGDIWTDISTINLGREGGVRFRYSKKPEALLQRVLEMSTEPGDAVIDPFGGSGTTAAVAHKLGRRWCTIESGAHARSHIVPRLRRVVAGDDSAGITAAVGWTGGGGFVGGEV